MKLRAVSGSFLKKVIILNVCPERNPPEKCMPYFDFSNIQRSNLLPRYQGASHVFPKIIVKVVGLLYVQPSRVIYFQTGNHQESQRDAEAATELNPSFLKAIVRG